MKDSWPLCVETIECPMCDTIQQATVEATMFFNVYIHDCISCGYTIMEDEWNPVGETHV